MQSYKTDLTQFYNSLPLHVKQLLNEYKKPLTQNKVFINKSYLKINSKKINFNNNRWTQKPHLFCYDNYSPSEQYLYPLILTVNNIKSIHEFISENFIDRLVYLPRISTIQKVLSDTLT